jgi:hypothetical protein
MTNEEILLNIAKDMTFKVSYIIDWLDAAGYLPDHSFTWPDGETWTATGKTNEVDDDQIF